MLRKHLLILIAAAALMGCAARPARAQFTGYSSPQTVSGPVFSAQAAAAVTPNSGNAGCVAIAGTPCGIQNLGQNVHFLTYTVAGANGGNNVTALDIRLEGSNDGVNFFPISDDATDGVQGEVYAWGVYPVIRANLVTFTIASGTPTVTASYSGTSGGSGVPIGLLNPTQTTRKIVFYSLAANANHTVTSIPAPFGSTLGYIIVNATGAALPAGSSLAISGNAFVGNNISIGLAQSAGVQILAEPNYPASTISAIYVSGGASAANVSIYYVFVSPSAPNGLMGAGIQSPITYNSENTSGANAAVTVSITGAYPAQRVHLNSVSARCSAGTAQLQVKNNVGGTVMWSTSATEVGTTTFKFQWTPALASSMGAGMDIVLGACGAANTGTLDVQASQF